MFGPNSLNVAHYAAFIWAKPPTKWNAQLPESNFQTHSRTRTASWSFLPYLFLPLLTFLCQHPRKLSGR
ncbi:DUF6783 domain-containing protein [Lachnospiraceae bacterium 45-P1]